MVICKCRKATELYCFVHKVPVCGECICFTDHQICVVRTFSEWFIDGGYDWPPNCCSCDAVLEEKTDAQTTRLGCLHVIHTNCLVSHIKGFPPQTAPAGYVCPACSTSIWPPKHFKDSGSRLHLKLKEAIVQNLFGNHPVSLQPTDSQNPPPAFASDPLKHFSEAGASGIDIALGMEAAETGSLKPSAVGIVEIDGPKLAAAHSNHEASFTQSSSPPALSTLPHKFLRSLLPFWSSALPTLPVTAPPRKEASNAADGLPEGRTRHHRSSRVDPRKILLYIAIMACMATMGILYYRIAQRGLEQLPSDEQQ